MITCRLKGGLGNMMFQIAAIESAARRYAWKTCYPNAEQNLKYLNDERIHNPTLGHALDYLKIFRHFGFTPCHKGISFNPPRTIPFGYTEGFIWSDRTVYDGFFQSEKWFKKEVALELFEFSQFVKDELASEFLQSAFPGKDSCFVHVRRGERVDGVGRVKDIHPITTEKYIKSAMEEMGDKVYYVVSDDIEWCLEQDFWPESITYFSGMKDYGDLYLMSLCRNAIIGPSTFSWWGAWLGEKERVIAPDPWLLDGYIDTTDVIPERWEKIPM